MAASTKDQLLRELAKLSSRGEPDPKTETARKARIAAIRAELNSKHGLPEDQQDDAALELTDPDFAKKPVEAKTEQPKPEESAPEPAKSDMAEASKTGADGGLYGNLNGWLYNFVADQANQQAPEQPAQPDVAMDAEKKQAKDRLDKLKADKAALDQQPQPAAPQAPAPVAPVPAKPEPEQIDRSKLPGFSKRDEQMLRRAVQLFNQSKKGGNPQTISDIYGGLQGKRIFAGSANERGDISWAPPEIQDFVRSKYNTDWIGKDKQGRTNDVAWDEQFKFQNRAEPDYAKFTNPENGQQWRAVNGNFEVNVPNENGDARWVQQPQPAFVNQLPEADRNAIFPAENTGWGKLQQHFGEDWNQKPNETARDWHMRQVQMLTGNPNGDTYYSGTKNGQQFNAVVSQKYGGGGFATFGNAQPSVPAVAPTVVNPPVPDVDAALSVPPPKMTPKTA